MGGDVQLVAVVDGVVDLHAEVLGVFDKQLLETLLDGDAFGILDAEYEHFFVESATHELDGLALGYGRVVAGQQIGQVVEYFGDGVLLLVGDEALVELVDAALAESVALGVLELVEHLGGGQERLGRVGVDGGGGRDAGRRAAAAAVALQCTTAAVDQVALALGLLANEQGLAEVELGLLSIVALQITCK